LPGIEKADGNTPDASLRKAQEINPFTRVGSDRMLTFTFISGAFEKRYGWE
jgi:hypothetical protein